MGKLHKLKVVPQSKMHYQDLVDYHFAELKELIQTYCEANGQESVEKLEQSFSRLRESQFWWESWVNED